MGKSIYNQVEKWPDGYLDIFLLKSRVAEEIVESIDLFPHPIEVSCLMTRFSWGRFKQDQTISKNDNCDRPFDRTDYSPLF